MKSSLVFRPLRIQNGACHDNDIDIDSRQPTAVTVIMTVLVWVLVS
jgi:hypothetical protein